MVHHHPLVPKCVHKFFHMNSIDEYGGKLFFEKGWSLVLLMEETLMRGKLHENA